MSVCHVENVITGNNGAALGFIGSEIYLAYPGLDQSSRTHGARFERDVHVAVLKTPVTELFAGLVYGYDFGMGERIAAGEPQVMGADKDFTVFYDHAADRAFTKVDGLLGFLNCFQHKAFVSV